MGKQVRGDRAGTVRSVLIIDDDPGTCETIGSALKAYGVQVETADCGAAGLAIALSSEFDLLVLDLKLPDMLGTDFVRTLNRGGGRIPFVLVSGFLSTAVTVEAMKLGAVDVVEKPFEVDDLLRLLHSSGRYTPQPSAPAGLSGGQSDAMPPLRRPGSAAERWAMHVLKACESEGDLKTLEDWAGFVGLSYTSLRESCRLVDVRPHDARDLMRLLRAVIRSRRTGYPPEVLLDVSDGRTLKALFVQAGIDLPSRADSVSVEEFLKSQTFVGSDNAGLGVLRHMLFGNGAGLSMLPPG